MTRQLTARGVKTMLSRAGVDYSEVTITEYTVPTRTLRAGDDDFGPWENVTSVIIEGPRDVRCGQIWDVLFFDKGLSCAPYPDRHEWCRR